MANQNQGDPQQGAQPKQDEVRQDGPQRDREPRRADTPMGTPRQGDQGGQDRGVPQRKQ